MINLNPGGMIHVLEDLEEYCLENSMPESKEAIAQAIQKAKTEFCLEIMDAGLALKAANALKEAGVSKRIS